MNEIPRLRFAHLPTAVEEMPRLSHELGGPKLLVKRDDQTGLAFGGNKTRKLEFLLAEATARGADMLVTAGALQSNHCRQTAAAAARFGLECRMVLVGQPPARASANLWLDELLGASIMFTDRQHRDEMLQQACAEARAQGRRPYLVPYGGSNATGALGYAFAVQELTAQVPDVNWIVFPTSSGGTQAGIVAGARIFGCTAQVLGISVDEPESVIQGAVAALASEVAGRLGSEARFHAAEVLVNADYCTAGYGVLTDPERQAIRLFARTEGLLIDPVYTGRAAAGLIALVRAGFFKKDEVVLFWHTGGAPALFADQYSQSLL